MVSWLSEWHVDRCHFREHVHILLELFGDGLLDLHQLIIRNLDLPDSMTRELFSELPLPQETLRRAPV